ncbi:MAG: gliding motility lipoprotein GldH [Chitinophagaceae bacterium]
MKQIKQFQVAFRWFIGWKHKSAFLVLSLVLLIVSCSKPSPQFQENFAVPGGAWAASFQPTFHFDIDDTAAAYQIQLLIRHTDIYPFSNIWLTMDSKAPGDTTWGKVRVEVPLAASSGQWLGRGMGEIVEQRVPITSLDRPAFFPKKGRYTVRLTQDMRRNPLPEVLTVGIRLEKLPPFKKGN